ncbi:hypothetical protein NLJ89_g5751 [Agrocybe chaxingu]|uniref:Uncharacterized protein n=1 Tax=Agrocybe chaxingu TaxID=84603 RepID=A0A9W8MWN4_9AGAR|nr:hypothetical protein NLJ89_g5751 [Agrocybe chaxingu]
MNEQVYPPSAAEVAPSKLSQVWDYAKLVSEQISAVYSRRALSGRGGLIKTSYPLDRKVWGRDDYLTAAINQIEKGVNSFCIVGPPGIGKSAVAAAILYHQRTREHFGIRRHWARLTGVKTFDVFLDAVYRALCVNADNSRRYTATVSSLKDRFPAIIRMLQFPTSSRLLILNDLDGVEGPDGALVQAALKQLIAIPHLTVIITTQNSNYFPQAASRVNLPPLPPRDAKMLFLEVYPYSDIMLDDLVKQLDCHPLAITVVARLCQLRGAKPSSVLREWQEHGLISLPTDPSELDGAVTLAETFDGSINRVSSPEAAKLFRILCALPTGIVAKDLSDIAPTVHNVEEMTALLRNISLTSMDGQHLRVLSPIRSHVVKNRHLDRESRNNLYFYFFNIAKEGLRRPGDASFPATIRKLLQYQENIETILFDALDECDVSAIEATLHYSSPRCAIRPRLDLVQKAVKAAKVNESNRTQGEAIRDGSMMLTAQCIQRYGEMNIDAGTFDDWFGDAIKRFEMLEDWASIEHCKIYMAQGIWINDQKQGIKELEVVRDRLIALGDIAGEARCQLKLAEYYTAGDMIEEARGACQNSCAKHITKRARRRPHGRFSSRQSTP